MAAPEPAGAPARSLLPWIGGASVALFGPLLFPLVSGKVFTRDDFAALHLPFRYLYREALQSGASWLWTSAYHSGFYLHGEGIAGMAHPLHLLLYRFLPLGLAFNLEIVIPFAAMLVGTWLLLRQFELASEAAWFGATGLYVLRVQYLQPGAHEPRGGDRASAVAAAGEPCPADLA